MASRCRLPFRKSAVKAGRNRPDTSFEPLAALDAALPRRNAQPILSVRLRGRVDADTVPVGIADERDETERWNGGLRLDARAAGLDCPVVLHAAVVGTEIHDDGVAATGKAVEFHERPRSAAPLGMARKGPHFGLAWPAERELQERTAEDPFVERLRPGHVLDVDLEPADGVLLGIHGVFREKRDEVGFHVLDEIGPRAATAHPQRHFGGAPVRQQIAISEAMIAARAVQNRSGWRSAGSSKHSAANRAACMPTTTHPCHVTGGPHPQP